MKVDELKQKVADIKQKRHDLNVKESIMNAVISSISDNERFDKTSENLTTIQRNLAELVEVIENQNSSDVIEAISDQTKALNVEKNEQLVSEIKQLIKEVQKLDKKEFSQEEFDSVFNSGIDRVFNVIVDQNEIAEETIYARNKDGKILSVTEKYKNKTIVSNWNYSSRGDLIRVTTKVK